jgi:hypothetical protein
VIPAKFEGLELGGRLVRCCHVGNRRRL